MLADRMRMAAAGRGAAADGGNDEYTKLLMHMEGTDNSQIFTDSSVGSQVKIDSGGIGDGFGVFNGTDAYLSVADHADWNFGTGEFTIETRMKLYSDSNGLIAMHWSASQKAFQFYYSAGLSVLRLYLSANGSDNVGPYDYAWSPNIGQWYHVALVRYDGDLYVYVDGVKIGSEQADATNIYDSNELLQIGLNSTDIFHGQMDELRISNVARYTTGFTPSTTAFTSDANTKLLLHMDLPNTDPQDFVDSGDTGHNMASAAQGGVYQKATDLGIIGDSCGYFDGDDTTYLSIADHADWDFGSGDFTIETWAYTIEAISAIFGLYTDTDNRMRLYANTGGNINFWWKLATVTKGEVECPSPPANTWNHIAVVREGNDINLFLNGVLMDTADVTGETVPNFTSALLIGNSWLSSAPVAGQAMKGYFEELRITKGEARYTANFNPPVTAFTSDANTKLLLHFDNGEGSVSFDDDGNTDHTVTPNGNAIQVIGHGADAVADVKTEDTAYKFGTTSAYFDGTGDYITLSDSTDWDLFASADSATIDFWVKHDDHASYEIYISQGVDTSLMWNIYHNHGAGIAFQMRGTTDGIKTVYGAEITDTDWHHVAFVKNGTAYELYLDGDSDGNTGETSHSATLSGITSPLKIGIRYDTPDGPFAGYIDELRISKFARWTSNFTPPTAAYYENE
jgi:hypothetical protein